MKYVRLKKKPVVLGDIKYVAPRPEHVSEIEEMEGGVSLTMIHGRKYDIDGSLLQIQQVLESQGDDVQTQMVQKIDGLMEKLIPIFNDIERRLKILETTSNSKDGS